jgi:hypothetical protein
MTGTELEAWSGETAFLPFFAALGLFLPTAGAAREATAFFLGAMMSF